MTTEEFSNEFDILLYTYSPTSPIEVDEYEKSVFLTKAQEDIIIELYSGKNPFEDSFEKTEELRRYLDALVKTYTVSDKITDMTGLSSNSVFYEVPNDLWFITYESIELIDEKLGCSNNTIVPVIPIKQDDYSKVLRNPFRNDNKRRALRLDPGNGKVEVISKYNTSKYLIRYISRPSPIILTELPDGLSINNISIKKECELNPVIHRAILDRAVKMTAISKVHPTGD